MAAWSVVIGTVILVGIVVVVLARQGSPGRLSEHHGPRRRRSNVVDRPAGPDAETMHVSRPDAEAAAPPDRDDVPGARAVHRDQHDERQGRHDVEDSG